MDYAPTPMRPSPVLAIAQAIGAHAHTVILSSNITVLFCIIRASFKRPNQALMAETEREQNNYLFHLFLAKV